MNKSVHWPNWLTTIILLLVLALLFQHYLSLLATATAWPDRTDFAKFHQSAQQALAGKSPYLYTPENPQLYRDCGPLHTLGQPAEAKVAQDPAIDQPCLLPNFNLNPPPFVLVTLPLGFLDYQAALAVWFGLSSFGLVLSAWLLVFKAPLPEKFRTTNIFLGLTAALMLYYPTQANFQLGQVTFLLLPTLIIAWLSLRQGRYRLAGALLGLAMATKLFLGLFLIGLILQRNFQAVKAALIAGLIFGAAALGLLGISSYFDFFEQLRQISWTATSWNASIRGTVEKLTGTWHPETGNARVFVSQLLILLLSLVTLLAYFMKLHFSRSWEEQECADLIFMLTLPAMLLLSPLGWMYYLPLLLIPGLCILRNRGKSSTQRFYARILILALFLASALPSELIAQQYFDLEILYFAGGHQYFLAYLGGFLLSLWILQPTQRD